MYHTENWKELIVKIAGEFKVHDSRDSWLLRAARLAQISHRQASDLFYERGKRDPNYSIGVRVKAAADKIDREIEKARLEAAHLTTRYTQIVTVRGSINVSENLLGATALDVLNARRLLGGVDLSGDHRINIVKK